MVYETVSLHQIGTAQTNLLRWGVFTQPLAFIIFFVCGVAENKRIPFDIPEAESEIVAGYFTEYSGMKFIMFWMSEFLEVVIIAFLSTAIFLGAWHIPFVDELSLLDFFSTFTGENLANVLTMLIAVFVFMVKVCFMIVFQMTIRWTLPRFRYDQVMNLGWKILLPLSLINIVITGGIILL
jgi:NADH-quinone oxidoreductase subunit H